MSIQSDFNKGFYGKNLIPKIKDEGPDEKKRRPIKSKNK